jgi:hypothetical protein
MPDHRPNHHRRMVGNGDGVTRLSEPGVGNRSERPLRAAGLHAVGDRVGGAMPHAPGEVIRYARLLVRLRGDDGPAGEQLWAVPIDATRDGGTYRLANNGLYSPLVIDDVVEAERDAEGQLQITSVRRGGRPGWLVHLAEGTSQVFVIDEWRATGTRVEWDGGWTVSVALDPTRGAASRPSESELVAMSAADRVLGFARLSDGVELTPAEAASMDLELAHAASEELESVSGHRTLAS